MICDAEHPGNLPLREPTLRNSVAFGCGVSAFADGAPSFVRFETADGVVLALNRSTVSEAPLKLGSKREKLIWMRLRCEAAQRLEAMTRGNLGKSLAVIYNGRIVQRVVIQAVISASSSKRGLVVLGDEEARLMLDAINR